MIKNIAKIATVATLLMSGVAIAETDVDSTAPQRVQRESRYFK